MASYDALGAYVQYETSSFLPTRVWSRDTSSGTKCYDKEKYKYYVLKNPPATIKGTPQLLKCKTAKTVVVGNITYVIDSSIYAKVVDLLSTNPVNSLVGLRDTIARARAQLNIPAPIGVQLQNVPLRNVMVNKKYVALGDEWKAKKLVTKVNVGSLFKFGRIVSPLFDLFSATLPYINFWSGKFNTRNLNLKKAQFFYAQDNEGCLYRRTYIELFTTALRSGATILPPDALILYRDTGIINFEPFPASSKTLSLTLGFVLGDTPKLKVGTFQAKFGAVFIASPYWVNSIPETPYNGSTLRALIREEVLANSEFIFIPIESQLDIIENFTLGPGTGFYFPITNGGDFQTKITPLLNQLKNEFADFLTLQNQDYTFSPSFAA
jgi:hypothetical protein